MNQCDVADVAMSDNLDPMLEEEEKNRVASSLCLEAQKFPANKFNMNNYSKAKQPLIGHMKMLSEGPRDESVATLEDEAAEALILLSQGMPESSEANHVCSNCNRRFRSYHALGGHKAGHKSVKGCFHNSLEKNENQKDGSSQKKVKKLKMKRKKVGQEKLSSEGVAERLAIELDNHCTRKVKIFSSEKNRIHSGCHKFIYKKEFHLPFELNLKPKNDATDLDCFPLEKLDLELRLGS